MNSIVCVQRKQPPIELGVSLFVRSQKEILAVEERWLIGYDLTWLVNQYCGSPALDSKYCRCSSTTSRRRKIVVGFFAVPLFPCLFGVIWSHSSWVVAIVEMCVAGRRGNGRFVRIEWNSKKFEAEEEEWLFVEFDSFAWVVVIVYPNDLVWVINSRIAPLIIEIFVLISHLWFVEFRGDCETMKKKWPRSLCGLSLWLGACLGGIKS